MRTWDHDEPMGERSDNRNERVRRFLRANKICPVQILEDGNATACFILG